MILSALEKENVLVSIISTCCSNNICNNWTSVWGDTLYIVIFVTRLPMYEGSNMYSSETHTTVDSLRASSSLVHRASTVPNLFPLFTCHMSLKTCFKEILFMSSSSILVIYWDLKAVLFPDNGKGSIIYDFQPAAVCRSNSSNCLVLYSENRKLQYITCPSLTVKCVI